MTSEEREMLAPMQQAIADAQTDAALAETVEGMKHRLYVLTNRYEADQDPAAIAALRAKIATTEAAGMDAYTARIAATWTLETTIARRAEFNAAVQSPLLKQIKLPGIERKLGYTMGDLKTAVKLHNL